MLSLCQPSYSQELSKEQKQMMKENERKVIEKEMKILQAKKLGTIRVYPDIITNLALKPNQRKPQYIQLRIDLIAIDKADAKFIDANQPLFQDPLILFLNKQESIYFGSKLRNRSIKKKIIKVINAALYPEVKRNLIKGIIIQKLVIE